MSKLNRILWAGLVLGVAACGDDVTVTPPPEPTPGIRSVSVAPNGVTIQVGGSVTMTAAVVTDPGATGTPTIAWSSSAPSVASVGATSGVVSGVAPGSAGITATATLGSSVASGNATVTVVAAPTCSITGVSVSPASASLVIGQTLSVAANVSGTNCTAAQLGVTFSTSDATKASVNATTGVVTAVAAGSATITATSNTDASKKAALSVTVAAPVPAAVSILSITQFATNVPVDLSNVGGQIEVTLNIDPGSAPSISKAQVLVGGTVVAEQIYTAASPAWQASPELAVQTLVMSVNTRQVKKVGNLYVPVIFNGPSAITARVFVTGSATPVSSQATPVVMQNADAMIGGTWALAPASLTPTFTTSSPTTVWYKGNVTIAGGNYVSFFPVTPSITLGSAACGSSNNAVSGTPTTGISLNGTYTCGTSVEGPVAPNGAYAVTAGTAPAADVIYLAAAGFEQVGTAFTIDGSSRWNLLIGGSFGTAAPTSVAIDNKAPTVTINTIAFNINYDQQWINASYAFSGPVVSSDAGTGVASERAVLWNKALAGTPPAPTCASSNQTVTTGADLAETLTSDLADSYQICASATDNIGNAAAFVGPSNNFGVDKTKPSARLAGSSATAAPSIAPALVPTVSATANTTVYDGLAVPYAGMFWGLEGFDNRSGFNQLVVTGNDAACQSLYRTMAAGATPNTAGVCNLPDGVTQVLSDTWIRSTTLAPIDGPGYACAPPTACVLPGGTGYYDYSGYVIDRAGNQSDAIVRNFAIDLSAPATSFLAPAQTSYTAGQAAAFNIWATDDLEVLNSYLSVTYPGMGPPATGLTYPYGSLSTLTISLPWPSNSPIVATAAQQQISIPNILGRVDESCTGAATPYPNCPATPGSKTPVSADYNWDLNLNAAVANDAAKAPVGVITNVQDIAGRDGLTGAAFSFSIATPMGSVAEQWSAAAEIDTWTLQPAGTLSCPSLSVCADQKTQTSNGLQYFSSVGLWRLNTVINRWVYCGDMTAQALPQVDNGVYRIWRWTKTVPTSGACVGAGFTFWRALGIKNGAGLFSLSL